LITSGWRCATGTILPGPAASGSISRTGSFVRIGGRFIWSGLDTRFIGRKSSCSGLEFGGSGARFGWSVGSVWCWPSRRSWCRSEVC